MSKVTTILSLFNANGLASTSTLYNEVEVDVIHAAVNCSWFIIRGRYARLTKHGLAEKARQELNNPNEGEN